MKCHGEEIVIQIRRWFIRAASFFAVLVLCSCWSTYTPDQSSSQKMSPDDARKLLQNMASYAHAINGSSIAAIHITQRTIKIDVEARLISPVYPGHVIEVPLKEVTPSVFCNVYQCFLELKGTLGDNDNIVLPHDATAANRLSDALLELKQASLNFASPEDDARFAEAARTYRASAVKPQLPEAARQFAVQAEGAIDDKDFDAAADYYEQALEIAPWWPQGHYDRAMVLATGVNDYPDAIIEMKRYLTLVPDAQNARALQDKIYNWERKAPAAAN